MKFALDTEISEFASSVDEMLGRAGVPAAIRAWNDGDTGPGLALWGKLGEQGVFALLAGEDSGGMGATAVEGVAIAEVLGRHGVPGPVVETMFVAPALGLPAAESPVTVAAEGVNPFAAGVDVAAESFHLASDGAVTSARLGEPQSSVDRARTIAAAGAGETIDLPESAGAVDPVDAINHGALGTAALQLGLASAMLGMAVDYAKQRSQFGRPIGEQQAIKHKAADMAIAIEMARPLLWAGALAVATNPDSPATAARDVSAAAVACGEAADLARRNALQIHGAIGYTMEHDLGLYLTKSHALGSSWGSASYHRGRILEVIETEGAR